MANWDGQWGWQKEVWPNTCLNKKDARRQMTHRPLVDAPISRILSPSMQKKII